MGRVRALDEGASFYPIDNPLAELNARAFHQQKGND